MSKFFNGLPPDLEQYNPDNFVQELNLTSFKEPLALTTTDDEGQLHSYDDFPSSIKGSSGNFSLRWHKHGVLARDEGKPLHVKKYKTHWGTYDANGNMHSYNGMPAEIVALLPDSINSFIFKWAKNGMLERAEDKPSLIRSDKGLKRTYYFKANEYHRFNGLPSITDSISNLWVVSGSLHNEKGAAKVALSSIPAGYPYGNSWHLYGIRINEEKFNEIKTYQTVHRTPLWVAFLHSCKLIDDNSIANFIDEAGIWNANLPTNWILQAFNITEDTWNVFATQIYNYDLNTNYIANILVEKEPALYSRFLNIIEYEETISS